MSIRPQYAQRTTVRNPDGALPKLVTFLTADECQTARAHRKIYAHLLGRRTWPSVTQETNVTFRHRQRQVVVEVDASLLCVSRSFQIILPSSRAPHRRGISPAGSDVSNSKRCQRACRQTHTAYLPCAHPAANHDSLRRAGQLGRFGKGVE